jgi:hypothetical protein
MAESWVGTDRAEDEIDIGDVVTFVHDYDLRASRTSTYHFKRGETGYLVQRDEKGAILRFPHGVFRIPYQYINVKAPEPPPKTRFDLMRDF